MKRSVALKKQKQGIVILLEIAIYACFLVAVYFAIVSNGGLINFATAFWNHLIIFVQNACTCIGVTCIPF